MTGGRISFLVSKDLMTLLQAIREIEPEMRKQLRVQTKNVAGAVWTEAVRGYTSTRLEARALAATARVAVSDSNITLKSAAIGKVHGTPASVLAAGAEFGADPNSRIRMTSRRGTKYYRRLGDQFRPRNRKGYVVYQAAADVIPRVISLWIQTAIRTIGDKLDEGVR